MTNIEGIQVLNTYVTKSPNLLLIICIFLFGLFMGICGFWLIFDGSEIEGIFCIAFSIIIILLATYGSLDIDQTTHYDALIDESTPFIKVYDKYDIEGKDGDIYHLILRKQTEKDKADD